MDFDDADMILIPIRRPNLVAGSDHRLPPRCGGPIERPASAANDAALMRAD
jgi:hypothetical protein